MRKFIAYILLALTMVGIGVGLFAPTMTGMNLGSEFQNGREYVYQVADREGGSETKNEHTTEIANIFRQRLDTTEINTYNVTVEGDDTIRVQFAAESYKYDYIQKYLNHSPVFADTAISTSADGDELVGSEVFEEGMNAKLEMKDGEPVVTLPVKTDTEGWKNLMTNAKTIADAANAAAGEEDTGGAIASGKIRRSGESSLGTDPGLFIWTNKLPQDTYSDAQSSKDPRIGEKILLNIAWGESEDGSEMFYDSDPESGMLLLKASGIRATSSITEQITISQYTFLSKWLVNMLNAEAYSYDNISYDVSLLYDGTTGNVIVPPTTEALLNLGNHITVRASDLLIAFVIAFALIVLVFGILFRLSAVATCSISFISVFLTFALFSVFSIEFNIAAVIGLIVTTIASFAGQAIYLAKLKKEYASGKSLKKANEEASRKSILPVIDISIVQVILGAFFFLLGGRYLMPFGIIMLVGGLFNALMNTLGMKGMMYLATNESSFEKRPRLFGLDPQVEPSLDEKETGEEDNAKSEPVITRLAKNHSPKFMIGAGVLLVAAIVGISVIGALNDGNILNNGTTYSQNSRLYIEISNEKTPMDSEDAIKDALGRIYVLDKDGKVQLDSQDKEISLQYTGSISRFTRVDYLGEGDDSSQITLIYYVVSLSNQYDGSENALYVPVGSTIENGIKGTLNEKIQQCLATEAGADVITGSVKLIQTIPGQPNTAPVILPLILGLLVAGAYLAIRYRLSRGLSAFLVSAASGLIILGFMALTMIPTTSLTLLSAIIVSTIVMIGSIFYLTIEKDNIKELKVKRLTTEQKRKVMINSVEEFTFHSLSALLLPVCFAVPFLVIGPTNYITMFAVSMIGFAAIGIPLLLIVLGPMSFHINRLLLKLWNALPKPKPNKEAKSKKKRAKNLPTKGAEPQESVFIGINDFK